MIYTYTYARSLRASGYPRVYAFEPVVLKIRMTESPQRRFSGVYIHTRAGAQMSVRKPRGEFIGPSTSGEINTLADQLEL